MVDHYGIDVKWETLTNPYVDNLIVIDDLANRIHKCDVLIDQNYYYNMISRYDDLVPSDTILCLGPKHALVRHQFQSLRTRSLSRRENSSSFASILVSLGGSDPDNLTQEILCSLPSGWSSNFNINVVIGSLYPHLSSLRRQLVDFSCIKLFRQTEKCTLLCITRFCYYCRWFYYLGKIYSWSSSIAIPSDIYESNISSEASKVGAQISLDPYVNNFRDVLRLNFFK